MTITTEQPWGASTTITWDEYMDQLAAGQARQEARMTEIEAEIDDLCARSYNAELSAVELAYVIERLEALEAEIQTIPG